MAKLVSKTYADALFSVALEKGQMDTFFDAAKMVVDILYANQEFGELMNHPKVSKEEKVKMAEEVFATRIPSEMVGLMTILITKGRGSDLLSVFHCFIELVKEEKKIGKADITTAIPLDEGQKEKVEKKLLATTKYESFEMVYRVDPSLIGGMKIRIGDRVVDSSVKTKLQDLTRQLREVQV